MQFGSSSRARVTIVTVASGFECGEAAVLHAAERNPGQLASQTAHPLNRSVQALLSPKRNPCWVREPARRPRLPRFAVEIVHARCPFVRGSNAKLPRGDNDRAASFFFFPLHRQSNFFVETRYPSFAILISHSGNLASATRIPLVRLKSG